MLKKNLSVLWALTDSGVILQNLNTNTFYELTEVQEKIWAYVDGTHTEEQIADLITREFVNLDSARPENDVNETIKMLLDNELIENT